MCRPRRLAQQHAGKSDKRRLIFPRFCDGNCYAAPGHERVISLLLKVVVAVVLLNITPRRSRALLLSAAGQTFQCAKAAHEKRTKTPTTSLSRYDEHKHQI
jgi:hypothetical protein